MPGRRAPTTTSSRSAAAAWPPPSWPPGCAPATRARAVARHLPAPDAAQAGPACWTSPRRATAAARDGRAGAARGPRSPRRCCWCRCSPLVGLRWAVALAALGNVLHWFGPYPVGARPCPGGGSAPGLACCSARRAGSRSRRAARGCCCAGVQPGHATRAAAASTCGCGRPSGWPSSAARPRLTGVVADALRPGAGRPDRRRTSTCTRCRRSPACSSSAGAARSSPRWTCPATGWTATGWRSARSRSAPAPWSAPAAPCFPGARVGKRAEVAPGPRWPAQVPTGQRWAGAPAAQARQGGARAGPSSARRAHGRRWAPALRRSALSALTRCCRALAALPGAAACFGPFVRGLGDGAARRARSRLVAGAARAFGAARYALLLLVGVRLLSLGLRDGLPPRAQPDRLAGLDDRAADGRGPASTLFPLYAGPVHAGVAAGCSA